MRKNLMNISIILTFFVMIFGNCSDPASTNTPPSILSLTANPDSVEENGTSELTCNASDPDNDNLRYTWDASSGSISGSGNNVTWSAPNSVGTYAVSCNVSDGNGGQDIQSININVFSSNSSPTINSLSATPDTVSKNGISDLICIASDPDNDPLSYNWIVTNGTISGTGDTVSWIAPDTTGTFIISCTVSDGNGGESIDSVEIVVDQIIPTAGLISYYPFDGNANDESGNNKHGTVYGNSTQFVTGVFDQAIKFDNSGSGIYTVNDYVRLPNITANEITISHWVKFISGSSTSYPGVTYSIGQYPARQFQIEITNSGGINGVIIINNVWMRTTRVSISDHQWHLITVTLNSNYISIFKNGSKIGTTNVSSFSNFTNDYHYVSLHRFINGNSSRFTGEIDDLYIYNRVLSDAEVLQLYNK